MEPGDHLEQFVGRFLPEVAAVGRAVVARLRQRLPGCDVLVYDNYNALAVAFSPNGKTSSAFLSVAHYPRWVSLFMNARLDDPEGLLKGSGSTLRHVVLKAATDLDSPGLAALIDQAIATAGVPPMDPRQGQLLIKSVSAKQRPRRPS